MKFSIQPILTLLIFFALLSPSFAASLPTIQITVENASLKKGYFEVADSICSTTLPHECKIAKLIANSKKCGGQSRKEECVKSREIVKSGDCVEGLVFNGWLESGEKVGVSVCADQTGKGRIKTRNSETAPWTLRSWIEAGETVSIK